MNYENRLQAYYREAHIQDETEFVEVYRRGVYNKELRKLLMLHNLPLTSIECWKAVAQHYQTQLLIYTEITLDIEPSAIARLGDMQYGLTDRKQETIQHIQELQQQLAPAKEHNTDGPMPMEIGAITEEEGRRDNDSQTTKTLEELFFKDPDHEMM